MTGPNRRDILRSMVALPLAAGASHAAQSPDRIEAIQLAEIRRLIAKRDAALTLMNSEYQAADQAGRTRPYDLQSAALDARQELTDAIVALKDEPEFPSQLDEDGEPNCFQSVVVDGLLYLVYIEVFGDNVPRLQIHDLREAGRP